ncbi:hypothetical protein [Chengkuizengella axinellae]|uniref:HNH endonuclease n=1 Tax=Chengkuizengella axinellae TaxID=3064388 RepID=A0ABT9J6H1_9BACL|nr:hypothetical protein [Chengkuizengella sp. 2205SS18-9]MDP5277204.1 hypothetical protein [Chengkuizengella sp. 2205SS18-9]
MNLANQPVRSYSKETQLASKRVKPTQRQMGEISNKVRKQVKERSKGICEVRIKCRGSRAYEQAHITGRGHIDHKTTADDLKHACVECHDWLDETVEGIKYKRKLREKNEFRK